MDVSVSLGSKYVSLNPVQLQFFLDIFLLIPVFIHLFFIYFKYGYFNILREKSLAIIYDGVYHG